MTDKARIKIAAAVTALFLAGISAAGLAARDHQPQAITTATPPSIATPARTAATSDSAAARGAHDLDAEGYEEIENDE